MTADLAERRRQARSSRKCSLCGSPEREVVKLISGPRVFICDGCVSEGQRLVSEASAPPESATRGECAFCRKTAAEVEHLVGGGETLICDECLGLCDDILSATVSDKLVPTTFTLRSGWPETKVAEVIRRARQTVATNDACAITVLVDPHMPDAALALLQRLKTVLSDGANVWQPPRQPSRLAVVLFVYPRADR